MTTKLKTYPKYPPARRARAGKPSGVDWLGDIPAGWEVKKIADALGVSLACPPFWRDVLMK